MGKPSGKRFQVLCQKWEESERGWGTRPDGYSLHKSDADREQYIREHMKKNFILFEKLENRDTFFERVHRFVLPYHEGALLIAKAYQTAKNAHRGMKRKRGERYFEHCRAVALVLMDHADVRDPEVLTAALLHDIVEDVPLWDVRRVRKEFGPRVAELVSALTIPARKFKSREKRLSAYHRQLCSAPKEALTIKLADRLHNLMTSTALSRNAQLRMVKETEAVYLSIAKERGILCDELCAAIAERRGSLGEKKVEESISHDGQWHPNYLDAHEWWRERWQTIFPDAEAWKMKFFHK
ncbi:MAG: hypothetical protein A2942_01995 [Candidatus Lloydbacteria bacterium RIFCSPLOWO2_01_FULL_50_20]|uniref:HD domain-containing protein n=1 Tax=Candidatus Lloydbacteria bacterium RIFCSPLOWO2_01_FULL_50_20 TaxID=1798665 RepID=A0A1G2DE49_9BACT|nr:MAG: hypothetical protein A2942_01995 [Candidatus Lloydbacteria bacterium RIFCSPLOWO2_01_FULL_50_20]